MVNNATLVFQMAPISNAVTVLATGEREESLVVTDKTFVMNCQDVVLSTTASLVTQRDLLLVAPSRELELKVTAMKANALPLAKSIKFRDNKISSVPNVFLVE